jgi:hypothetical protein
MVIEIGSKCVDKDSVLFGQCAGFSQTYLGDIDCVDHEPMLSKKDRISPFACSQIESSPLRDEGKMSLKKRIRFFAEGTPLPCKSFVPPFLVRLHSNSLFPYSGWAMVDFDYLIT